jgi:pimeloyl-ACP methyl ester carboxylesterase
MNRTDPTSAEPDETEHVRFPSGAYRLFGKLRAPDPGAPALVLLHGLGFHSFEYDALAPQLARRGLNSLAFDFRGHGRSDGPRGRWTLPDLVEDAVSAVTFLGTRVAGPIGVFGNSLGAIVGLHLAVRMPDVRSLVASGCPTRVSDFAASGFRSALLAAMRAIATVVPIRVSVNHFIPYERILRDPLIIDRVRRDPLVTDARRFAPSTYADMLAWNALDVAARVKVPLLVLYATDDGLQGPEQSTMLFDAARCEKEIRGIDAGHVPDLEAPELLAPILVEWFGRTLDGVNRGAAAGTARR